ncbi:MAG: siderophore ABC transporter substrate-binding protein [Culicoidibacterales bacterium]
MNKKIMVVVILIIAMILAGYFTVQIKGTNKSLTQGIEIVHELGMVKISETPKKVVVFDYGTLDSLEKLEIPVAGVAKSSLPSYLSKFSGEEYADIGSLFEPNFETLAKLKPDVIFISGRQQKQFAALNEIAPTIYLTMSNDNYMSSLENNLGIIGKVFNKQQQTEKSLASIKQEVESLANETKKKDINALIVLTSGGELNAYGPKSRFGIIHNTFGIKAIDAAIETATHGQSINYEYILEKNPNYIYVIDRNVVIDSKSTEGKTVFENDLMRGLDAYKQNKITYLNPESWYLSSGGLTSTSEMIKEIRSSIK